MAAGPPTTRLDELEVTGPLDRASAVTLVILLGVVALLILAMAFDWIAAKGVLIVGFLSVAVAYLVAPAMQALRMRVRWHLTRFQAAAAIYLLVAIIIVPIWLTWGGKISQQVPDVAREVPGQVGRFVQRLRDSERWHERFTVDARTRQLLQRLSRGVSERVETEVRAVAGEILSGRGLIPWLASVPLLAFVLVVRWKSIHRSAARGLLATPHLQWRTDQFLRQVNLVLAAYTRAQAISALFVGTICGLCFVLLRLPNAAMLGIVAGLLELVPIAGPLAVAISATSVASSGQVVIILAFLGGLRIVQDYVVYPRLIRRAMHLHPLAVVAAIWLGAALGGIVGVLLAVPTVGILQVARRQWREYRDIERLVSRTATGLSRPSGT
ncbi:MAG: AI-2E family transporter [Vicinamibacterales bacterium]